MRHLVTDEVQRLRAMHYNAEVVQVVPVHEDLRIIRIRHDAGRPDFLPGQYASLGLGAWEARLPDTQPELSDDLRSTQLIKRAYSISSPILDDDGRIVTSRDAPWLEFYIALVRSAPSRPPALTPRLFMLDEGARLWVSPHAHGGYTLPPCDFDDRLTFVATGTGEAPHNAMIAELLAAGHMGDIVNLVCVRYLSDLGYLAQHRRLEQMFANYRYIPLTTREPWNVDAGRDDYVGKQYVQDYVESDGFQRATGRPLTPERTHVFLCGNAVMIGLPARSMETSRTYPSPVGMIEVLERRGFRLDKPHKLGNVHFEKYW